MDTVAPLPGGILVSFSELQLASGLLAFLARTRGRDLDWRPVLWGAPFLAAVALSGAVNIEWYKVFPHLIRTSEWLAACFLTLNAFNERGSLRRARWVVAGAGVFYCIAGFLQLPHALAGRIFSYFTNANQFAGYLGMLFPFFVMFYFTTAGRRIRPVWGYLALLTLLSMVASASRAGLLGLLVCTPILWWLHYRNALQGFRRFVKRSGRSLALHGLMAGLALLLALWLGGFDTLARRIQRSLEVRAQTGILESVAGNRLPYFRLGMQVWKEHWLLGVGPGRWKEAVEARLPSTQGWEIKNRKGFERAALIHCHNLYLQLGGVYGLLGLLAFLFWVTQTLRRLAPAPSGWSRAGVGLLAAFLVHNMFDVTFPSLGQEMGCLIGLALAGARAGTTSPEGTSTGQPKRIQAFEKVG
ncbi:MAG: O-antigen ligase family protein [Acidobacteriota bacterium]